MVQETPWAKINYIRRQNNKETHGHNNLRSIKNHPHPRNHNPYMDKKRLPPCHQARERSACRPRTRHIRARKLQGKNQHRFEVLKSNPTSYTSIGLFTGAGGTALGFENAGIGHIVVNEIDKHAAETLRMNRPEWNVIEDDIHDLHFDEYAGKVDIVEGGFPCQAFSHSGKRLGFKDARGTLFNEFARVVEETNPKIVMGENVKGLVTHDKGQTLPIMIAMLEDLGYDVAWKVLKSHFLDVGQKRERLIIIGKRHDIDSPILFPQEKPFYTSVGDVLEGVPDSPGLQYEDWKREVSVTVAWFGYLTTQLTLCVMIKPYTMKTPR